MTTLRIAALQPLHILVLAAALFGGITLTIWWLLVGIAVYLLVTWLAWHDPLLTAPPPPPRPRITSPMLQAAILEIERSQREVEHAASGGSGSLVSLLTAIVNQTRDLVADAYMLAEKGQIIERYLGQNDVQFLDRQIAQINWQISANNDPFTIQQLQERRHALLTQQQHINDLRTYLNRIKAQLDNIDASLDTTLAEIIRLRTADAVAMSTVSNTVQQRLSDLRSDMEVFRRVLDTAISGI